MRKYHTCVIILLLAGNCLLSQSKNNLIRNGSFEIDSIGQSVSVQFWESVSGTPDIDNAKDAFSVSGNLWSGVVVSSIDGGNWVNIGGTIPLSGLKAFESIGQVVELSQSIPHKIEFEYTSQSIKPALSDSGYSAIDVYVNYELVYTTPIDSTLFTWNKSSFTFIPQKKINFIQFQINSDLAIEPGRNKYVAIDGVCVMPIKASMFCEP